jgi:hypothetical protein
MTRCLVPPSLRSAGTAVAAGEGGGGEGGGDATSKRAFLQALTASVPTVFPFLCQVGGDGLGPQLSACPGRGAAGRAGAEAALWGSAGDGSRGLPPSRGPKCGQRPSPTPLQPALNSSTGAPWPPAAPQVLQAHFEAAQKLQAEAAAPPAAGAPAGSPSSAEAALVAHVAALSAALAALAT